MRKKIDFINLGVAKCGTTWFRQCCDAHPEIAKSKHGENRFFDKNIEIPTRGLNWYNKRFNWSQKGIQGDFSTTYCLYPSKVAPRILQYNPSVKLILLIRHPYDRVISQYRWELYKTIYFNKPGSRWYIDRKMSLIDFFNNDFKNCKRYGLYTKQINGFLKIFPISQLLIITLDEVKTDIDSTMTKIFTFLNVSPNIKNVPLAITPESTFSGNTKKKDNDIRKKITAHLNNTSNKKDHQLIYNFYEEEICKLKEQFDITLRSYKKNES